MPAALCLVLGLGGEASAASLQLVNEFGSQGSANGQLTAQVNDLEVAPSGNLIVTDAGNFRVSTFTPGGSFVRGFGSSGTGPGQFANLYGAAIQGDGTIFAEDPGHGRVEVFSAAGTYLREFTTPVDFYADIALSPAETILYLVDYQSGNIQLLSPAGANLGLFGSLGTGPGQFLRPLGMAVDSSGNLYVADRDGNRVEKLSPSGAFLTTIGGLGSGNGQTRGPTDVAIAADGHVFVADTGNFRVVEFTGSGQFVASYDRIAGSPNPNFVPTTITTAPSGDIYVFDRTANTPRILRVRAGPPPPVLGKTVDVATVSGTVRVRERGTGKFHVLTAADSIPVGSSVDTTNGRVKLTAAKKGGGTQSAEFFQGQFKVRQSRRSTLTDLKLEGSLGCARRGSRVLERRRHRRLWGRGKGRYSTSGHNGSGTVRGTYWLTEDRCDGTLFKVKQGVVVVRDFTRHRKVTLHAGQSYLAPAP